MRTPLALLPALLPALLLAACRDAPPKTPPVAVATAMDTTGSADSGLGRTYVFLCDNAFRFVARLDSGHALIALPGTRRLRFAAVSDTLYRGREGSLRLWAGPAQSDAGTATPPSNARAVLVADGTERPGCVHQPRDVPWENARLAGVAFRAMGSAPQAWNLDLYGLDSLAVFVTDGGRTRWRIPAPAYDLRAADQEAYYRATADGQPFVVHLQGRGCTDAATGERLPTTVAVSYRGQSFAGCGRELN